MKKLFYTFCILAVPVIVGILLYQRLIQQKTQTAPQNAQTIIPAAPQVQAQEGNISNDISENTQSVITLLSDEVLISEVQADLNGDGKEDKIIAAKKLSDQFIYFLLFLQDAETQIYVRAAEIKTEATHAKTLVFYTLTVQDAPYPVITYSGMNADALQIFGMYALNIEKDAVISADPLVSLQADGQIELKNSRNNFLSDYTVYAYYSDSDAPNTLNQIEKQYNWNETKHIFQLTKELKIPGKKIESQFLKKFQTGNIHVFQEFLEGVWYQPAAKNDQHRSIYFNQTENKLIFSVNTIQEIFTIDSVVPRRFGVSFSTKNAAISSIHRRIDIELTGVDEINIRVVDNIARIKIGVSSNWDGVYRKLSNNIREVQKDSKVINTKKSLTANGKTWISTEGYSLNFSDDSYQLLQDTVQESGWYTVFQIRDNMILQLKNKEGGERFFTVAFDTADKKLNLTEVFVTLNGISATGTPPLIFE